MPTSHHTYISDVVGEVRKLNPQSILDIGFGFGKWGMLFREYLDVMAERVFPEQWKIKIDGVEIYESYVQKHQKEIYDDIFIDDICKLVDSLGDYDLIFMSDVLEHIEKEKAQILLAKLAKKCKHLFIVVPIGSWWLHDFEFAGNKHEKHISSWLPSDFQIVDYKTYTCNFKPIAFFKLATRDSIKSKYTFEYFLGVNAFGEKVDYGVTGMKELSNGSMQMLYKNILDKCDFENKVVLDVGCGRGDTLSYCLKHGAKKVIGIDFAKPAIMISQLVLSGFPNEKISLLECDIKDFMLKEKVDYIIMFDVLEHVEQKVLQQFFENNLLQLNADGKILWHTPNYENKNLTYSDVHPATRGMHLNKKSHKEVESFLETLSVIEKEKYIWIKQSKSQLKIDPLKFVLATTQNNILLQRCNVWWKGGTGLFTIDVAKAYPEFHHVICYRHNSGVDFEMLEYAKSQGIEVYHLPQLNEKFLEKLNPFATILHNPGVDSIADGVNWLANYPVITWHHSRVKPWFQTKAHIFVSEYLKGLYGKEFNSVPIVKVIPPCINVPHYAMRKPFESKTFVFGVVLAKNKKKFSKDILNEIIEVVKTNQNVSLILVGGCLYLSGDEITELREYNIVVLGFNANLKPFYHSIDCLIYYAEIPDTWGRVVTEGLASRNYVIARNIGAISEQIDSDKFGVLVDSKEGLGKAMMNVFDYVYPNPKRPFPWFDSSVEKAKELASYERMRSSLDPLLLKVGTNRGRT